jgi:hypothetical protein
MQFAAKLRLPFEQWPKETVRDGRTPPLHICRWHKGYSSFGGNAKGSVRGLLIVLTLSVEQTIPICSRSRLRRGSTENSLRNTWDSCAKLTRTSALPRACITFDWGFRLICPKADWSWLLGITKPSESTSIGAQPATSDRLHRPGGISRRAYAL